jgi:hypothetical protein
VRPHVELILESDYIWHTTYATWFRGSARHKVLSADEEDGAATFLVEFENDGVAAAGTHGSRLELFVLEGRLAVGEDILSRDGYLRVHPGKWRPEVQISAGTRILLFLSGPSERFEPGGGRPDGLVLVDAGELNWEQSAEQVAGLLSRILFVDPTNGASTSLVMAPPGWLDPKMAHHLDVSEEEFVLDGTMSYNYGKLVPGAYFFRPPRILHGQLEAGPTGCRWLIRTSGKVERLYTGGAIVTVNGIAENYDPTTEGPLPGVSLRSSAAEST